MIIGKYCLQASTQSKSQTVSTGNERTVSTSKPDIPAPVPSIPKPESTNSLASLFDNRDRPAFQVGGLLGLKSMPSLPSFRVR